MSRDDGIEVEQKVQIVDLAQAVENDYIGSPCGKLDQTMVLFAKEGMGTYYNPKDRSIEYVPMGKGATDFRIVVLDTGTDRPGLEKSTYAVRRRECEELVGILQKAGFKILGTIFSSALFPNRAPAGHITLTSYIGGARYPELGLLPPEIGADTDALLAECGYGPEEAAALKAAGAAISQAP